MTLFFIAAALLVAISLAWLLIGSFRPDRHSTDQEAVNITLARERRQTLENALADGSIDQSSYDYERQQLEYDLASDLQVTNKDHSARSGHMAAAVLVAVFVPISAGALYLHLGNPSAITQPRHLAQGQSAQSNPDAPSFAELLPQLEQRLAAAPDDIEGWRLLGRSHLSLSNYAKAVNAFESALTLDENDVDTLAQLAESVAMTQGGDLTGQPVEYLLKSNTINPRHEHTLWLLSIARQQAGEHEAALAGFDQLLAMAGDNIEVRATIEQMRTHSAQALATGTKDNGNTASTNPSSAGNLPVQQSASTAVSVNVSVAASPEALKSIQPDQVLFIYATATNGPPMPLAVQRLTAADMPLTVTLDDAKAMMPTMTLSSFADVTIGARISSSGTATAQAGDWFDEQANVSPATTDSVELLIDKQLPQ